MIEDEYQKILLATIDFCVCKLDMHELTLNDIGRVPDNKYSWRQLCSMKGLPNIITYEIVKFNAQQCTDLGFGFRAADYYAHFGLFKHLEDLREVK